MLIRPLMHRATRLLALASGALAVTFACVLPTAEADTGSYRDRGDRYSRAQSSDDGAFRNRTRADSSRSEPARGAFTRDDGRARDRYVNERAVTSGAAFTRSVDRGYDRAYDRGRSYRDDRYERHDGNRYRYVRERYTPRSSVSVDLRYSDYGRPHYDYRPTYSYGPRPYSYRPAYSYHEKHYYQRPVSYYPAYRPYYGGVTHVTYSYSTYRPYCAPSYGIRHSYYPRYSYPRSGLSIGIRYDYRR